MFGVDCILCGVFSLIWSECQGCGLARPHARDSTIHYHLLYVDIKSAIYKEAEKMDVGYHDYYITFMDYVSPTSFGFASRGRVSCIGTVGDMYGYE